MIRFFLAFLALSFSAPLVAHEGHKKDKSDAEMAVEAMMASEGHAAAEQPHAGDPAAPGASVMTPAQAYRAQVKANRLTGAEDLLGRMHPIAAHFPIALLIVAALAELVFALRPGLALAGVVRLSVAGGAIGAVVAALLGWFAAGWRLSDRSELLGLHRWNGTALAGASMLAWWLASREGSSRLALRLLLVVIAMATAFQGYLGGEMVFGPNHLGLR